VSFISTTDYLPFGGVETSTGNPIELRFPGQWFQSESGLPGAPPFTAETLRRSVS